jgi:hypothetical protein
MFCFASTLQFQITTRLVKDAGNGGFAQRSTADCRTSKHSPFSQPCQQIAADYSLENQQERINKFKEELLKTPRTPNNCREIVDDRDENSLLHMNHIDSAKVGRWQEDLSAKEVALIENKVRQWCKENEYESTTFLCQLHLSKLK